MKKTLITVLMLALGVYAGAQAAKSGKSDGAAKKSEAAKGKAAKVEAKNAWMPNDIQWGPAPPVVPAGAQMAVLEGNPMGTGEYTIRFKMPNGYKVMPHWHPKREAVTVLSGTLKVGMGDKWDDSKMAGFGVGSFAYLDPSMHHYVSASGETVIQIHGQAPVAFHYVNPADDPSKKK
jgi:hypothetical protein